MLVGVCWHLRIGKVIVLVGMYQAHNIQSQAFIKVLSEEISGDHLESYMQRAFFGKYRPIWVKRSLFLGLSLWYSLW